MLAPAKWRIALLSGMVLLTVGWMAVRSQVIKASIDAAVLRGIALALASGVAVALAPGAWIARASRAIDRLSRSDSGAVLGVAIAALAVGLATAWSQQPFSWDEPYVIAAARIVAEDGLGVFFSRYASIPWLGTNHPPLVILLFGGAIRLLGPSLFPLRLLSVAAGAAATVTSFAIARRLVDRETALASVLLLLASPLYDRMCSAAMNDIFVTLCFSAALLLMLRLTRDGADSASDTRGAVLLGVVVGIGMLVKYTMVLAYPVLAAILVLEGGWRRRRREAGLALAISLALLGAWLIAAWNLGVLDAQSQWTTRMAGQTTRSSRGAWYALDALFTKLPSGFGVYDVPLLAIGIARASDLGRRTTGLLAAWIALVSLPLLFTLPDNRYFLPAYPAIAILAAAGLARFGDERARIIALSWLLCATTLAYYASVDLKQRAFLFRYLFSPR